MQTAKLPVFSTLGQGLTALFRARTHLHVASIGCFLAMAVIFAAVLFSLIEKTSIEIFVGLSRIELFMLIALVPYSFWLYRRFRLRELGVRKPLIAFLQMLLFTVFLMLLMFVFTLLAGVCIFIGATLLDINVNAEASVAGNQLKMMLLGLPAAIAGVLIIARLMPGLALAARGEGIDLSRTWAVLHGNFWRFFAAVMLFNVILGVLARWVSTLFWEHGQQVAISRDFGEPYFYAFALLIMFIHMWNTAGMAFIVSRVCDVPVARKTPTVNTTVSTPATAVVVKKTPVKKAAAKRTVAKKAAPQKAPAKKAAAPKSVAKKKPVAKKKKA